MADVINKIRVLEELAGLGADDEVFIQAIDKLTRYKIKELEKDLKEIEALLTIFEDKHNMKNDEFLLKFESDKLNDEMDYLEWSSLLDMRERINMRLEIIRVPE